MRKVFSVIVFSLVLLLIGRNLTFLPRFDLFTSPTEELGALQKEIKEFVDKKPGSYSVYYVSLNSERSFGIHENQIYTAASVNKVPIAAVLYHLADKGHIDLDETIALQETDIQNYGTGSLRYQAPGMIYSLRHLTKLALHESDNTAAYILGIKIGTDTVQKTIDGWGLSQTSIVHNKTSLSDMHLLYRKIYKNEVANEALTKELLGFMKNTLFEDRLALYLPADTALYHKTGDEVGIVHDVGIIQKNDTAFFLGVFTSDIGDTQQQTKEAIGTIAQKVLNFELRQQ